MLVKQALRAVGFSVIRADVHNGDSPITPLSPNAADWSVSESVLWEGEMRYGLFLICHQQGVAAQVFDLANSLTALPASQFQEISFAPEKAWIFGKGGLNSDCSLLELSDGALIGWNPLQKRAVCLIRGNPVWYSATSVRDAAFMYQSGMVQRCQDIQEASTFLSQ